MGVIFSRYRKKKSSEELLEKIQRDIDSIDHDLQYAFQRQKVIVGRLVVYSVTVYIIIAIVFYLFFFPPSMRDRIIYVIPLLLFPLIIVFTKRFVTWVYKRDIVRSQEKLAELIREKKKTLDEVMNKETYKKAKEILEKYAPEQTSKSLTPLVTQVSQPVRTVEKTPTAEVPQTPLNSGRTPSPRGRTLSPVSNSSRPTPVLLPRSAQPLPRKLVRPIFQLERGYLDRFVEALVGDGPNRRYALICKHCASHNGMALKEEFEYLAYRCVYCGCPNPAMKVRPRHSFSFGPRIDSTQESFSNRSRTSTSEEGLSQGEEPTGEDLNRTLSSPTVQENTNEAPEVEKLEVEDENKELSAKEGQVENVEGDDKKNR